MVVCPRSFDVLDAVEQHAQRRNSLSVSSYIIQLADIKGVEEELMALEPQ